MVVATSWAASTPVSPTSREVKTPKQNTDPHEFPGAPACVRDARQWKLTAVARPPAGVLAQKVHNHVTKADHSCIRHSRHATAPRLSGRATAEAPAAHARRADAGRRGAGGREAPLH